MRATDEARAEEEPSGRIPLPPLPYPPSLPPLPPSSFLPFLPFLIHLPLPILPFLPALPLSSSHLYPLPAPPPTLAPWRPPTCPCLQPPAAITPPPPPTDSAFVSTQNNSRRKEAPGGGTLWRLGWESKGGGGENTGKQRVIMVLCEGEGEGRNVGKRSEFVWQITCLFYSLDGLRERRFFKTCVEVDLISMVYGTIRK